MEDFVHLSIHTHYSKFSGLSGIKELVDKAISCDMRGMAITDNVNMCGIKEFDEYVRRINKQRKNEGLEPFKPIFGCDLFVVAVVKKVQKADYIETFGCNTIVLAKNLQGYRNLVNLVSSYGNDDWNWPIELDVLEKYHEGLIVCSGQDMQQLAYENDEAGIRKTIEWYHNLFGDDYYFDLQRHEVKNPSIRADRIIYDFQEQANAVLTRIAKEYGIKLVATNGVLFTNEEDAEIHDRIICESLGRNYDDNNRPFFTKQEWLKSREEMNEVFQDVPEALSNTMEILDKVGSYSIDHDELLLPPSH